MIEFEKERRKFERYDTEVKVYFRVNYDIKTKVKFRILSDNKQRRISREYSGLSKNIGVEGLRFVSKKKLEKGDMLLLKINIPNTEVFIQMEGEVRWSKRFSWKPKYRDMFHTGVRLISVNGKSVADSIHYDEEYKIVWSIVLESVLGSFKEAVQRLKWNKKVKREKI
ncbi:MAG: PilZ domain-containing protein [Candidatus Omnitrophica bacterium]|nr:PilZ domain-containing protein [Candidatus Omnitrophota bacterium]